MSLVSLQALAVDIAKQYAIHNKNHHRKSRHLEQYMAGMVGDVGDLQKLIMAKCGYRQYDDLDNKIQHELSDVLRALLVIADSLDIDMASVFEKNMSLLKQKII